MWTILGLWNDKNAKRNIAAGETPYFASQRIKQTINIEGIYEPQEYTVGICSIDE